MIATDSDLEGLRKIGRIVARCLKLMTEKAEPGMTTLELDNIGRAYLELHGAQSAPILTYKFPGATCISVEDEAAHGIPGPRVLHKGDLVNVDVSAELGGYFADTGGSFIIPPISAVKQQLCDVARAALKAAIAKATAGAAINQIGLAIETEAKRHGLTVIRNLCSHGVGRALHEEPDQILGYYDKRDKRILKVGTVMTIEPFISNGADVVEDKGDDWTLITPMHLTAQYEHTMVITKSAPLIMTLID